MLLSKLLQRIFVRSGQFVGGNLSSFGLSMEDIWNGLESDLTLYESFVPVTKSFNITSLTNFYWDFTQDPNNTGYSLTNVVTSDPITQSIPSGDSSFTYTLANTPIVPGTLTIAFNTVTVATDSGGALVFGDGYGYLSGTIDYTTGVINVTSTANEVSYSPSIVYSANYATYGNPPLFVSKCIPIGILQNVVSLAAYFISPNWDNLYSPNRQVVPRTFLNEYKRPVLYFSECGRFTVTCNYPYQKICTYSDAPTNLCLADVEIVDIEKSTNFYILEQILLGRFMQIVGRSRRAFTIESNPIQLDSDKLVQEGTTIYDEAIKKLQEMSDWFEAIRA